MKLKNIMIYTKAGNIKISDIIFILKNNSSYIMIYTLLISGLIIGTTLTHIFPILKTLINGIFIYSDSIINVFIKNMIFYSVNYMILFVFGLSCIGTPFILLISLICGAYYGSIFTIFFNSELSSAFLLYLLLKLPSAIVFIITIIISSSISLQMSTNLNSALFLNSRETINLKYYLIKYIIIAFFGFIASLIDVSVYFIFNNILTNYI